MLFTLSSLLELFLSCCIVVTVAKGNLIEMSAIILLANFQRIQMLRHPWLAFDWLSVSFFDYLPIRMSGFSLFFCNELTLFCIVLPENCIYLNQSELSNFFMSIISAKIIRVISKSNKCAAPVRFDFRPKLHDTRFNYHFLTSILKSQKSLAGFE